MMSAISLWNLCTNFTGYTNAKFQLSMTIYFEDIGVWTKSGSPCPVFPYSLLWDRSNVKYLPAQNRFEISTGEEAPVYQRVFILQFQKKCYDGLVSWREMRCKLYSFIDKRLTACYNCYFRYVEHRPIHWPLFVSEKEGNVLVYVEHGWANFSEERPRFYLFYHLRPQSMLTSEKRVVCSLAVIWTACKHYMLRYFY